MSSTAVVQPPFDPEATLAAIAEHRADGLVVVPVMLQRILALGGDVLASYDTSRCATSRPAARRSGRRWPRRRSSASDRSSTTSTARPRSRWPPSPAPTTCGGAVDGRAARRRARPCGSSTTPAEPCPAATVGRVFVGSGAAFEGYTGGGGKEVIDGLLSSGDLGHFDAAGRLFIDGRDDDMIVSGGENVFPAEVEDLLAAHPGGRRGGGRRRRRRRVRPAARGLRRQAAAAPSSPQRQSATTCATHLARYKVPAGDVRRRAAPHRDRQGPPARPAM